MEISDVPLDVPPASVAGESARRTVPLQENLHAESVLRADSPATEAGGTSNGTSEISICVVSSHHRAIRW
ncbi:unnamed protein product [Sphagnum jensenii]|uniref:Uncharacterized protein n=1 Tax=Sphagnum jensenii TaxID=128206 RepID=A0ABP0VKB3_9BRYO